MGITDKAIEILLGVFLLAALVFLALQEISLHGQIRSLNRSLDNEIQCRVGSTCAGKLQAEADRGASVVSEARKAADAAGAAQKAALDQQTMDAVRGLQDALAAAKSSEVTWQQKYQQALQKPDCALWAKQTRVCALH